MNYTRLLVFLTLSVPGCSYTAEYKNLDPFGTPAEALKGAKEIKARGEKLSCPTYFCAHKLTTYSGINNLNAHLRKGKDHCRVGKFKCSMCPTSFRKKFLFERHVKETHQGPNNKKLCRPCNRYFSPDAWINHRKLHESGNDTVHKCGYCQRPFEKKYNCQRHENNSCDKRPNSKQVKETSIDGAAQTREQRQALEVLSLMGSTNSPSNNGELVSDLDTHDSRSLENCLALTANLCTVQDLPDPLLYRQLLDNKESDLKFFPPL